MSTTYEVPFEPLTLDGSNYSSWSAHVLNVLWTMGPTFERAVKISILPKDFDDLSKLSNEEKELLFCNCRVIDLLFENMDSGLSDSIQEENRLQNTRCDAHRLWKFIEAICEEDSDDEDQEGEEDESLEECTTTTTYTHPPVTPLEDQEVKIEKSTGSLVELVRPVQLTGQTGLTGNQKKKSK